MTDEMTREVNETKEFQSVEDVSQTQTIPTELTPEAQTDAAVSETAVFKSVADVEEADSSESDTEESDTAESVTVDAQSTETAPATPSKPDLNVPLMEAFAQPVPEAESPKTPKSAPSAPAAPVTAADMKGPKRGASVPTIIFGVLGMIIGVIGLICGWAFPGMLLESFYVDPRMLTAIICGAVGVILVIVAIIWAVVSSRKKQQR